MANKVYGNRVYEIDDIKITNLAGTVQEDLGSATKLDLVPVMITARMVGDGKTKETISYIDMFEGAMTAGDYSSAAMEIMTGITLTISGTSPNEITELKISQGQRMPYFKVYGRALDHSVGDKHYLCSKVKVTSLNAFKLESGNWRVSEISVDVLDDGANGLLKDISHETATALPSS